MTTFETVFEVRASASALWTALDATSAEHLDAAERPHRWWIPGFETTAVEVVALEPERLVVRKDQMPCVDTLITIVFEHVTTGTRITVVQSGFDEAFVEAAGDGFWGHAAVIADGVRALFESVA